jgi:hypothetical protein
MPTLPCAFGRHPGAAAVIPAVDILKGWLEEYRRDLPHSSPSDQVVAQ